MSCHGTSTLAIIPARAGSKGLPGKHLRPLKHKALIAWTIEAARSAKSIDGVLVSSDDPEILAVSRRLGAHVLDRPADLATDLAPSEAVLLHALKAMPETLQRALRSGRKTMPDITVLLQPTSPLRDAEDIDAALSLLQDPDVGAVISVCEPRHSPFKCFKQDETGCLRGILDNLAPFQPRQALPRAWMPNGAIYAVRTPLFLESGRLLAERTLPYAMSAERSVDIDVEADFLQAEQWLAQASEHRPSSAA